MRLRDRREQASCSGNAARAPTGLRARTPAGEPARTVNAGLLLQCEPPFTWRFTHPHSWMNWMLFLRGGSCVCFLKSRASGRLSRAVALAALSATLAACGGGTAAIASGGSSSGGGTATLVSDVVVSSTKTSPATISFRLKGPKPASVRILFAQSGGGPAQEVALVEGSPALEDLSAQGGVTHTFHWDFADQRSRRRRARSTRSCRFATC
jgi:hypothetical protein